MNVSYFGLSCFKIKYSDTVLLTDPFDPGDVELSFPAQTVDIVLYTHAYESVPDGVRKKVLPSEVRVAKGQTLLEISEPGEYEVGDIFVRFMSDPGVVLISMEDVTICYVAPTRTIDDAKGFDDLGIIHYLIIPVGDSDEFLNWTKVDDVIKEIDPGVVIPSCYRIEGMKGKYGELKTLSDFTKEYGIADVSSEKKLKLLPVVSTDDSQLKLVELEVRK